MADKKKLETIGSVFQAKGGLLIQDDFFQRFVTVDASYVQHPQGGYVCLHSEVAFKLLHKITGAVDVEDCSILIPRNDENWKQSPYLFRGRFTNRVNNNGHSGIYSFTPFMISPSIVDNYTKYICQRDCFCYDCAFLITADGRAPDSDIMWRVQDTGYLHHRRIV